MLLYLVAAIGVILVLQLINISQQLQNLNEQLHWNTDRTFANKLREWMQESPKEIMGEFKWYEKTTFAHELRDWLQEVATDITRESHTTSAEILRVLENIASNTSQ